MPGILPKRKFAIQQQQTEKDAIAPVSEADMAKQRAAEVQFDRVLSAVRDALTPERFLGSIRAPQGLPLRDAPITLQTLHNPGANPVTVSLSLDPGSEVLFSTTLNAGATLTLLGLPFPRLAGFVSTGFVIFSGELPTY